MNYTDLNLLIISSGFQPAYITEVTNAYSNLGCEVVLIGGDIHQKGPYAEGVQFINLRGDDSPSGAGISSSSAVIISDFVSLVRR